MNEQRSGTVGAHGDEHDWLSEGERINASGACNHPARYPANDYQLGEIPYLSERERQSLLSAVVDGTMTEQDCINIMRQAGRSQ